MTKNFVNGLDAIPHVSDYNKIQSDLKNGNGPNPTFVTFLFKKNESETLIAAIKGAITK